MTEFKGTAEGESPLMTSYLAGISCVHYRWQADEHWTRIVHETVTDSKGHTTTRTRTESGWTKIAGGGKAVPFFLKDTTGVIRVVPEGADIDGIKSFEKTCGPGDPLYFGKAPVHEIASIGHRRRFHETAIPLHAVLYVVGQAHERQDMVARRLPWTRAHRCS